MRKYHELQIVANNKNHFKDALCTQEIRPRGGWDEEERMIEQGKNCCKLESHKQVNAILDDDGNFSPRS